VPLSILRPRLVALLAATAAFAVAAGNAGAAEPTTYQLPTATHAASLGVTTNGTAWFVPSRGTKWEGKSESIVGSLGPDGTVTEHEVVGVGAIQRVAVGPQDEIWISAQSGSFGKELFEIARLSPTGELEQPYTAGYGEGPYGRAVRSLAVAAGAVWFVRQWSNRPESIERLDPTTGAVRQFFLRPRCRATALQPAPGGTVWFTEKCGSYISHGPSTPTEASIGRIEPSGKIVRRAIVAADYPVALTIGPEGTVWFGALRRYNHPSQVGHLTKAGKLVEFPVPNALPYSIAIGPEGRLWFQSSFGGWVYRALNSIDLSGRLGKPICAAPSCQLEPGGLTSAPDGSLWYGLTAPNLNTGGGGSGLYIGMEIANEAGSIAHLVP
jgi:streptogramin lyase